MVFTKSENEGSSDGKLSLRQVQLITDKENNKICLGTCKNIKNSLIRTLVHVRKLRIKFSKFKKSKDELDKEFTKMVHSGFEELKKLSDVDPRDTENPKGVEEKLSE